MDLDKEVFEGKKLSDLIKEAYDKHHSEDRLISDEIIRLADMITSPGEAIVLAPMIKPLIDARLKNDEVILKIVQVIQKAMEKEAAASAADGIVTQNDIDRMFEDIFVTPKEERKVISND